MAEESERAELMAIISECIESGVFARAPPPEPSAWSRLLKATYVLGGLFLPTDASPLPLDGRSRYLDPLDFGQAMTALEEAAAVRKRPLI